MIAAWMLFAVITGCALTAAAAALDHLATLGNRSRRFVWLSAMLVTTCWPAIALARTALFHLSDASIRDFLPRTGIELLGALIVSAPTTTEVSYRWATTIALLWALTSATLLARLLFAIQYARRQSASWRTVEVDGTVVMIADDAGPAVVGLIPMHIVLPVWVLDIEQRARELILRHESEHREARDPYVLLCATVLTTLFPWHPALWFQSRRLRRTIEIDCDRRVLGPDGDWREYAYLLLTIAQRRVRTSRQLVPALSEPASNLERRITAMRTMPTFTPFRAACLTVGATAAFAIACGVNEPQAPDRPSERVSTTNAGRAVASTQPLTVRGDAYFEFQVERLAVPRDPASPVYPASMKASGVGGTVLAQFVVSKTGQVDMRSLKVLASPGDEFTQAVKKVLPTWRFDPAIVGGKPVNQVVQQAFEFKAR